MRSAFLFLAISVLPVCSFAETFVVDPNGNGDFPTIQSAVDAVQDGDTVLLLDGIYTGEGNRDILLHRKAITLKSENGPEKCIIDCQGNETNPHRGFKFTYCKNYPVLDGITILNGYGPDEENGSSSGGGLYSKQSNLIIKNCVFRKNTAIKGGGIRAYSVSRPYIYNCKFIENTAIGSGGGFSNYYFGRPVIDRCVFVSNNASSGGAIHCSRVNHDSNQAISNCLIIGNKAKRGGGVYNHACAINYVNCTFVGNCATEAGPAILFHFGGERSYIVNSIVWGNVSYSNRSNDSQVYFGSPIISYSCIQDRKAGGTNHNFNPKFRSLGYWDDNNTPENTLDDVFIPGDYHLLSSSPCIDTGQHENILMPGETDLENTPRVINNIVDMGAYEFKNSRPISDAGKDITAYAWVDGLADVSLDGTGSYDPDGDALAYYWFDANELIATGAEPNVVLGVGEHVIELIVNDGIEDSGPNACIVTVIEAMEAEAKILPQVINTNSNRGQLIGRLVFEGELSPELDTEQPMLLLVGDCEIEASRQMLVYSEEEMCWYLVGFFDSGAVMDSLPIGDDASLTLVSRFGYGQWIYGANTVKVKH